MEKLPYEFQVLAINPAGGQLLAPILGKDQQGRNL
jgi:hypothetical protein